MDGLENLMRIFITQCDIATDSYGREVFYNSVAFTLRLELATVVMMSSG